MGCFESSEAKVVPEQRRPPAPVQRTFLPEVKPEYEEYVEEVPPPVQQDDRNLSKSPTCKPRKYKAAKGDDIDEAMSKIINANSIRMPIIRMGGGKYLMGTESKMVVLKGATCVVRIGGGFENLETYLMRHEEEEINKIRSIAEEQDKPYQEVIKDLLNKYRADAAVVNSFIKTMQITIAQQKNQQELF